MPNLRPLQPLLPGTGLVTIMRMIARIVPMPRPVGLLLLALSLLTAACGSAGTAGDGEVTAVAAVYPLAWVAERVAPDAEVTLLSAGGLEAHDVEISPSGRESIQTADVVLYVGEIGYQPQIEEAVTSAEGELLSLSEVAGQERLLEAREDPQAHEEEGGEQAGEQRDEDHGEAVVDAHIWFAPEVMADAAVRAGEVFAAADPPNAEAYRANAEALRGELVSLVTDLDDLLGGTCRHREAIVSHQAYGYLLAPYGIGQHGVTGINPEAGASSGELGSLVAEIEAEGFQHILAEPVEGREGAETLAREARVELLEISPLDAVTEDQAAIGFAELVRDQARQFATALGC